jgi:menaquinone-dependent protoporphyrinogen IX oxidase
MKRLLWICLAFILIGLVQAQDSSANKTILIAYKKSEFKEVLLKKIVTGINQKGFREKVIMLKQLPKDSLGTYHAVIIINEVWAWQFQRPTKKFIRHAAVQQRGRIIVVSTAANPRWKTRQKEVQAITSASEDSYLDSTYQFVMNALDKINKI